MSNESEPSYSTDREAEATARSQTAAQMIDSLGELVRSIDLLCDPDAWLQSCRPSMPTLVAWTRLTRNPGVQFQHTFAKQLRQALINHPVESEDYESLIEIGEALTVNPGSQLLKELATQLANCLASQQLLRPDSAVIIREPSNPAIQLPNRRSEVASNPASQIVAHSSIAWVIDYAISSERSIPIELAPHEENRLSGYLANRAADYLEAQTANYLTSQIVSKLDSLDSDLAGTIKPPSTVVDWCEKNGWSEPHWVEEHREGYPPGGYGRWWAFESSAVMATPLPNIPSRGKSEPKKTQSSPIRGMGELFRLLSQHLWQRQSTEGFRYTDALALIDYALDLLRPQDSFEVAHWNDPHTITIYILKLERVGRVEPMLPPTIRDQGVVRFELRLSQGKIEQWHQHGLIEAKVIDWALEALSAFSLQPHPSWGVGTTEQNQGSGSGENISFQASNQRRSYFSRSGCFCGQCERERFWQSHTDL